MIQNLHLFLLTWIAHGQADEKTIHLGSGQHEGTLPLHRILGSQHHKWLRQRQGRPINGSLSFLHSLQKRGLGPGDSPVDLICQQNVGMHRAFDQLEIRLLLVEYRHAHNIRR